MIYLEKILKIYIMLRKGIKVIFYKEKNIIVALQNMSESNLLYHF